MKEWKLKGVLQLELYTRGRRGDLLNQENLCFILPLAESSSAGTFEFIAGKFLYRCIAHISCRSIRTATLSSCKCIAPPLVSYLRCLCRHLLPRSTNTARNNAETSRPPEHTILSHAV